MTDKVVSAALRSQPTVVAGPDDADEAPVPDDVARFLAANPDLEVVELLLPDTNGVIRGKWGPPKSAVKAFTDGIQLPLSVFGLDVWGREVEATGLHIETGDRDGVCRAVPGSLRRVAWAERPTAQVLLTMHDSDGAPWFADPRHVLEAVLARFAARGLTPVVAVELEFYLLKPGFETEAQESPLPVNAKAHGPERQHMYAISDLAALDGLFAGVRAAAIEQGLPIDTIISEAGPGQFEVNLVHKPDAIGAADDAILLKRLIGGVARRHGLRASFMAKPFQEWPGNGMHVHVSLVDRDGENLFADGEAGMTRLRHAVAGTLATMHEALALFINTFNGYRRLAPGSYAPTRATWGHNNRSVAVRVPIGKPTANRLEHRIAGADANPHLVVAAVLAGMLEGLDAGREPPAPVVGNAYEGGGEGPELPDYMEQAIESFEASGFVARTVGEEFRRIFSELKKAELAVFEERISRLEHDTYL